MGPNSQCWFVYILSSLNGTLYVGMTDNLLRRMGEHRQGLIEGFTKKYEVNRLMYYETFQDPQKAAFREKQLKKYRREKKIALFTASNPDWRDLTEDVYRTWAL
jgi:putative endonuclease